MVLPSVNLAAGHQALPVSLPAGDGALQAEEGPVSTTCFGKAARNGEEKTAFNMSGCSKGSLVNI